MIDTTVVLTIERDGFAELASLPHSKWEQDLKAWKRSLPPNFKLDLMRPNDFKYRAVSHLYLNYYYCLITMGKVALMTVARKKLKQDDCDPPDLSDQARKLANCCMKAARKTLQLFEILSKSRKVTRFSFTDFQGCSIATIVTLVSGIMEKDVGYNLRVELGFKCLRDMATGNITAKLGVIFVEAVRSITEEAAAKLEPDAPPHQSSGLGDHSGYYRWKEWHTEHEGLQRDDHMARQQGTEFPMRADSDEHANPWLTTQSNFSDTCGWPSNVQEGITNSSITQSRLYGPSGSSQPLEHSFPSMIHNDEQSFLMGLTGLDALDFSGLGVQLE